ncbi:hypothetical protein [Paenibacillus sp. FSL H7-0326]|uniref:hypothetical protein n=1 Tax=Paenibacillus sp. FSL H7-0326 TaxID=1921144 RepID=UPI0015C400D2|nr:hypothetical protein [Paenibacillus sp. FSL H7-0326]
MEEVQTTNAPAQDKSYLRLGRFVNTGTLDEITMQVLIKNNEVYNAKTDYIG